MLGINLRKLQIKQHNLKNLCRGDSRIARGSFVNDPYKMSIRRNLYMKATGIVRRIDDLGRVVIPKEIRRTMRIREGAPHIQH